MTEVDYIDRDGDIGSLVEVYKEPVKRSNYDSSFDSCRSNRFKPYPYDNHPDFVKDREQHIVDKLEQQGSVILSINSTLISKRRYKRRLAKALSKQEKYNN